MKIPAYCEMPPPYEPPEGGMNTRPYTMLILSASVRSLLIRGFRVGSSTFDVRSSFPPLLRSWLPDEIPLALFGFDRLTPGRLGGESPQIRNLKSLLPSSPCPLRLCGELPDLQFDI